MISELRTYFDNEMISDINSVTMELAKKFGDYIWSSNYKGLSLLKAELEEKLWGIEVVDQLSFYLGKTEALIDIISFLDILIKRSKIADKLSPKEKQILFFIKDKYEVTPTELTHYLQGLPTNTSNYLSKLRNKGLLRATDKGRNKYYSLSGQGEKVLDSLLDFTKDLQINETQKHYEQFKMQFQLFHEPSLSNSSPIDMLYTNRKLDMAKIA